MARYKSKYNKPKKKKALPLPDRPKRTPQEKEIILERIAKIREKLAKRSNSK